MLRVLNSTRSVFVSLVFTSDLSDFFPFKKPNRISELRNVLTIFKTQDKPPDNFFQQHIDRPFNDS